MRKLILIIAAALLFAAVIPAAYAAVRVVYYPLTMTAKTGTAYIAWDNGAGGPVADATLLYGSSQFSYPVTIAAGTTDILSFTPQAIGMTGGVYYFRISNNADASWSDQYALIIGSIRVTYYPLTMTAKTGTVFMNWDDGAGGPAANATLLYGTSQSSYPVTIAAGATGSFSFTPAAIGMTGGVYYFRLSNTADGSWSNEYTLIIGKESGLNVSNIKFTPNPFSPALGGLAISYLPDSDENTTVRITIKAYTMQGKLVRTIGGGEMTAGTTAVTMWDGKTDLGYYAKNGRYIIQLEAHDKTGTKQFLNTVVLVK